MNYMKHYSALCSSRQCFDRNVGGSVYYEKHHIQPRSLGGSDDANNIVLLTPKEHYIAHLLLYMHYKQLGGRPLRKMAFALVAMTGGTKRRKVHKITSSTSYARIREAAILATLGRKVGDTTIYKKPKSDEHREAIRQARLNAPPRSEKTRMKMRESALKREKIQSSFTGNSTQVCCPHCNKTGQKNAMLRWHFDNCKFIEEVTNA